MKICPKCSKEYGDALDVCPYCMKKTDSTYLLNGIFLPPLCFAFSIYFFVNLISLFSKASAEGVSLIMGFYSLFIIPPFLAWWIVLVVLGYITKKEVSNLLNYQKYKKNFWMTLSIPIILALMFGFLLVIF